MANKKPLSRLGEIELDLTIERRERDDAEGLAATPAYPSIKSPDELRDASRVAKDLLAVDWRFTEDETRFLTHDMHPYPAKFIPQIPGHLISRLSLRGELVLDPFGGSGTTALEAVRLGRRALSSDANPLAALVGRVKSCNVDQSTATELHGLKSAIGTSLLEAWSPEDLCERYSDFIPTIPNIDKWFPLTSRGELAAIRFRIAGLEGSLARDIASLAMSRIILSVSYQDSETRYASRPREIPTGHTFRRFLASIDQVLKSIAQTQSSIRYGVCDFVTADARLLSEQVTAPGSVDLIVTSPPYGNATDYHLYHRFRLLWLGFDPQSFAKREIGSHLRHQRESTGFDNYLDEIEQSITSMHETLKPGRYAALVIGDAVYKRVLYEAAESAAVAAVRVGFEQVAIIERKLHDKKRSFVAAGRRATTEKILVLRKPPSRVHVSLVPPPYKLWDYEDALRKREIVTVTGWEPSGQNSDELDDPYTATKARTLSFTHGVNGWGRHAEPTWQAILENGLTDEPPARKDSKYVTHGLHSYKGKFYPQLAKALINISGVAPGSTILDPFCGSGTTLLEAYLNGFRSYGCDLNPLATKLAGSKVGILEVDPAIVREAFGALKLTLENKPSPPDSRLEELSTESLEEIQRWFPAPVIGKLNWVLRCIRRISEGVLRDFLEIVLSSIIREVSQQAPRDLRIRRRKTPISDADVIGLFLEALELQYSRIERFWSVRGYAPVEFIPSMVTAGDSREASSLTRLGLERDTVDLILTSPPYATALPYIDTDRLSLLVLFGLNSTSRRPLEHTLIGSREILTSERRRLERDLTEGSVDLPSGVQTYINRLQHRLSQPDVGFRRRNMPALLARFFSDMSRCIDTWYSLLKPGGEAIVVIGDNRIRVDNEYERIATTDFLKEIASARGFSFDERIDISVTVDNHVHSKNSITENAVLRLRRPG